jgi:hypothetical protein
MAADRRMLLRCSLLLIRSGQLPRFALDISIVELSGSARYSNMSREGFVEQVHAVLVG